MPVKSTSDAALGPAPAPWGIVPGALARVGVAALERIVVLPSRVPEYLYIGDKNSRRKVGLLQLEFNLDHYLYRTSIIRTGIKLPLPVPKAAATSASTLRSTPDNDLDGAWAEV